ncbi:MAG: hypothetical protein M3R15_18265 [Acidobacteriota bacterium]|nr:hypothetical protein [Acidobacteriota bacterium]
MNRKYKVGERVRCDFKFNGEFKVGTVVEVVGKGDETTCCWYRVKIDNDDPVWKEGRLCQDRSIRPIGGATTEKQNPTKSEPQEPTTEKNAKKPKAEEPEDFTSLADREILECPIEQNQVEANSRPDAEILKRVIRCFVGKTRSGWHYRSENG